MTSSRSRGQVLVIFAGGLLLLMAIATLVIDLGFVFMEKRQEQNAADPGSIAAARFIRVAGGPDTTAMRQVACFYAHQNGFFNGVPTDNSCSSSSDPDGAVLTVNYPPDASAGEKAGHLDSVQVVISRNHNTFFGGLFRLPTIGITSAAVAAYSSGDSNTSSLVALDPSACGSGHVHGSGGVTIHAVGGLTNGGYVQI